MRTLRRLLALIFLAALGAVVWGYAAYEPPAHRDRETLDIASLEEFLPRVLAPLGERYPALGARLAAGLLDERARYERLKELLALHNLLIIDSDVALKYDPTLTPALAMDLPALSWRVEHRYVFLDLTRPDTRFALLPAATGRAQQEGAGAREAFVTLAGQVVWAAGAPGYLRALGLEFCGLALGDPDFEPRELLGVYKVGPDRVRLIAARGFDRRADRMRYLVAPRPSLGELAAFVAALDDLPYAVLERLRWRGQGLGAARAFDDDTRRAQSAALAEDRALLDELLSGAGDALPDPPDLLRRLAQYEVAWAAADLDADGPDPEAARAALAALSELVPEDPRADALRAWLCYYQLHRFEEARDATRRRHETQRALDRAQRRVPLEETLARFRLRRAERNQSSVFSGRVQGAARAGMPRNEIPAAAFDAAPRAVSDFRAEAPRVLGLDARLALGRAALAVVRAALAPPAAPGAAAGLGLQASDRAGDEAGLLPARRGGPEPGSVAGPPPASPSPPTLTPADRTRARAALRSLEDCFPEVPAWPRWAARLHEEAP